MPEPTPPHYITFSNIIIDDIVLWDGRTFMNTLGGAGTHALIGMAVWSDRLGYVATVGPDFTAEQWAQLAKLNIDVRGVKLIDEYTTTRAWQLFEPDERRIEIMRTDLQAFFDYTPYFAHMPADYRQARGVHVQWGHTFAELVELLQQFHDANPQVKLVWEPALEFLDGSAADFRPVLERLALFSPDIEQAQQMTKLADPNDMAKALLDWGSSCVAIRMGAAGSIVRTAAGEGWRIPAVPPAQLVDVTGAGNAYCGGFIYGLGEGESVLESALHAAVSASFAIEQFGVPDFGAETNVLAQQRLGWAREHWAEA